jgi:hypothetical protein
VAVVIEHHPLGRLHRHRSPDGQRRAAAAWRSWYFATDPTISVRPCTLISTHALSAPSTTFVRVAAAKRDGEPDREHQRRVDALLDRLLDLTRGRHGQWPQRNPIDDRLREERAAIELVQARSGSSAGGSPHCTWKASRASRRR